jgi:trans-aconitate methyltransferase
MNIGQLVYGILFVIIWGIMLWLIKARNQDISDRLTRLEEENKRQFNDITCLQGEMRSVQIRQWSDTKLRSVITEAVDSAVNAAFDKNAREWLEHGWLHRHPLKTNPTKKN